MNYAQASLYITEDKLAFRVALYRQNVLVNTSKLLETSAFQISGSLEIL